MKRISVLFVLVLLAALTGCNRDPKVQSQGYVTKGNKYYEKNKMKEASIMYRRALQKDARNAAAWYKLGLLNLKDQNIAEARGAFVRVGDLADAGAKIPPEDLQDAYTKLADIDYVAFLASLERKQDTPQKEFRKQLLNCANKLKEKFPNSFDAYRVAGLYDWTSALTPTIRLAPQDPPNAKAALASALQNFRQADHLRPFEPSLGYSIVSTLLDTQQPEEAEKYANQMVAQNKADYRIYDVLWKYYFSTGHQDQAEAIRRKETENSPKDAKAWLRLAGHYAAARKPAEVTATLNRLTADTKTFPDAYMQVGDFYYANYALKEAVEQYSKGIQADPKRKATYMKKSAEAMSIQGRYDEAAKLVAEVLKQDPKDTEAIAMNASLQLNHAKPADADKIIGQLQPLLAKTPGEQVDQATIIHFNLGRAYALKGDPQSLDQARLQLQEVINLRTAAQRVPYIPALMALSQMELQRGESQAAVNHAEQILKLAPLNVTAHLVRTLGMANLGEYDKARAELNAIVKYQPKSHDARFQLARLNLLQKRYPEAEAGFESLQKEGDPRGYTGLIDSKVRQNKVGDAVAMVQSELDKTPNSAGLRNALAALHYSGGQFANAAADYSKLLEQNPNAEETTRENWTLRLGECLRRTGDLDGAIAAFNRAAAIAPKDPNPRLEIGILQEGSGKSDEARKTYEEVLKLQPDNPVALNNLAYYNADNDKDLDKALSYAQRAQQKNPKDLNIVDTIGLIYYKKDLLDESSRLFAELVSKVPNSPTYHLHLAMALYRKGDKPQARRELDAARRNRPSVKEQDQIKDLMSKIG